MLLYCRSAKSYYMVEPQRAIVRTTLKTIRYTIYITNLFYMDFHDTYNQFLEKFILEKFEQIYWKNSNLTLRDKRKVLLITLYHWIICNIDHNYCPII